MAIASYLLLAKPGFGQYVRSHFLNTTFRGLYQANAFDMSLLVPYFIVLILLASYGMHRYILVFEYYKHRKNRRTEPPAQFPVRPASAHYRAIADFQRAVRYRPVGRFGVQAGVSAREAGNPGAGRFDRRNHGRGAASGGALCGDGT